MGNRIWHIKSLCCMMLMVFASPLVLSQDTLDVSLDSTLSVFRLVTPLEVRGSVVPIAGNHRIVNTTDQLLQGSVAGLNAVHHSGLPGTSLNVGIRGWHSGAASNQPLLVLDGMPVYTNEYLAAAGITFGQALNPLSFLDPEDIVSITVLKDVDATALYGARGTNGVIVIETGIDTSEAYRVQFSARTGMRAALPGYDLADATQFAGFLNEAYGMADLPLPYQNPAVFGDGTNWSEEILRNQALRQQYRVQLRGGNAKLAYRVSGHFLDDQGVVLGSDMNRYAMMGNLRAELRPTLNLEHTFSLSRVEANTIPTQSAGNANSVGLVSGALLFNPLLSQDDGAQTLFNYHVNDDGASTNRMLSDLPLANPGLFARAADSETSSTRIFNALRLRYAIARHWAINLSLGGDAIFNTEGTFVPASINISGDAEGQSAQMQSLHVFAQLSASNKMELGGVRSIQSTLGLATEGLNREILGGSATGFENELLRFYSLSVGQQKSLSSNHLSEGLQSAFGRIKYQHNQHLELNLQGRADASSRFGGAWKFFPSAGFQWHIWSANATSDRPLLSKLILRSAYGFTGNIGIPAYSTLSILDQTNANINGLPLTGIGPSRVGNQQLEPEVTSHLNGGLDARFLQDRLLVSLDVYFQQTDNALIMQELPATAGYAFGLTNGLALRNSGIELSILLQGAKRQWQSQLTVAYQSNRVSGLPDAVTPSFGPAIYTVDRWQVLQEGASSGLWYGYQTAGLVQPGEQPPSFTSIALQPGDLKYQDTNGDGLIDPADQTVLGDAFPDVVFGWFNQGTHKSFSWSFLIQGVAGIELANFNQLILRDPSGRGNVSQEYLQGAGTEWPEPRYRPRPHRVFSDALISPGDYLSLRNITLAYDFANSWDHRFDQFKLCVSAENLLRWTKYDGLDPDVTHFGNLALGQGVDFDAYPSSRIFSVGLNVGF